MFSEEINESSVIATKHYLDEQLQLIILKHSVLVSKTADEITYTFKVSINFKNVINVSYIYEFIVSWML